MDAISNQILVPKAFTAEQALENKLIDEIDTFEGFHNKYYDDSKVQEISLTRGSASILQSDIQLEKHIRSLLALAQNADFNESVTVR